MLKRILYTVFLSALLTVQAAAQEKISIILDWYLNPDHAALIVAQQTGSFSKRGLDVELIAPSDPSMGPRLVAAKQADLAISYHQQLYMSVEEGLPLARIGTLIDIPLNTLIALPDSGIKTPADLKGKKVGYSVSGVETALLSTMLEKQGLSLDDIELVNVNFNLVSALISGRVDVIIGGYRNIEGNELREQGIEPIIMHVEDYGIPPYDELVIIANKDTAKSDKYRKFLQGLKEGGDYLRAHPAETWALFAKAHPELANDLNEKIWAETVNYFSKDPAKLDRQRYIDYGTFLHQNKLIKQQYPIDDYAIELN